MSLIKYIVLISNQSIAPNLIMLNYVSFHLLSLFFTRRVQKKKLFINFFKFETRHLKKLKYSITTKNLFRLKAVKKKNKTKLRSLFFFKKIKSQVSFIKLGFIQPLVINKIITFNLQQRLFTSKKHLSKHLGSFLFKPLLKKKKRFYIKAKSIIFLNAHKSLIWKMRKARYAHWAFRKIGKLNERKYHRFLGTELSFLTQKHGWQLLSQILLSTFTIPISWRHLSNLYLNNLVLVNGNPASNYTVIAKGDIVDLPYNLRTKLLKKKKIFKLFKRSQRTFFKFFKKLKTYHTIENRFVIPKIFKRTFRKQTHFIKHIAFDKSLNSFAVINNLPAWNNNFEYKTIVSSVIGLQNWKYKFD
jgi:hypothetical protein